MDQLRHQFPWARWPRRSKSPRAAFTRTATNPSGPAAGGTRNCARSSPEALPAAAGPMAPCACRPIYANWASAVARTGSAASCASRACVPPKSAASARRRPTAATPTRSRKTGWPECRRPTGPAWFGRVISPISKPAKAGSIWPSRWMAAPVAVWPHHCRADMRSELTTTTFALAARRQPPPPGLLHHSDRGVQYAAAAFVQLAAAWGVTRSMSRTANPYDNALAESFVATLKTECLAGQIPPTRAAAKLLLFDYIETFYNLALPRFGGQEKCEGVTTRPLAGALGVWSHGRLPRERPRPQPHRTGSQRERRTGDAQLIQDNARVQAIRIAGSTAITRNS